MLPCESAPVSGASSPLIAIDARKLGDYGIGRYIANTLRGLAAREGPERYRVLVAPGAPLPELDGRFELREVDAPGYGLREHLAVPAAARGCDLLHVPHYVLPLAWRGPAVVTIHDLIHLRFPQIFGPLKRSYARAAIASACRRARVVLTVSETVARDIEQSFPRSRGRVRVVPNEVAEPFYRPGDPDAAAGLDARLEQVEGELPGRFVLATGNTGPHKDLPVLVEAMARVREREDMADVALVLASSADTTELVARARSCAVPLRVLSGLGTPELAELFRRASILAHPSRYEGFGLPVAEALAAGLPVVAARGGATPEVVGEAGSRPAAELVAVGAVDELAGALTRVLLDGDRRAELARLGKRRAEDFRPGSTAPGVLEAYRAALSGEAGV